MLTEQQAFEEWIDFYRPSGDAESVQYQWVRSFAYAEFMEQSSEEQLLLLPGTPTH